MTILALGIFAAAVQTVGYLAYGIKILKRDIQPNATSWLMFAYGTTFLVVVEWDRDAGLPLLILPVVCAILSIFIAYYCIRKVGHLWWPEHPLEQFSFSLDIFLTILYVFAWILVGTDIITGAQKEIAEVLILVCWNISVFTAFFPLLRQVYHHPKSEHVSPWVLWTCAYFALACVTVVEEGEANELLLYPLVLMSVCAILSFHTFYFHYIHHKIHV